MKTVHNKTFFTTTSFLKGDSKIKLSPKIDLNAVNNMLTVRDWATYRSLYKKTKRA